MLPSEFQKCYVNPKFLALFRQVMAIIVGEVIMYYTERKEDGSFKLLLSELDQFERTRRDYAYSTIQESGDVMDKYLIAMRGLFSPVDSNDTLIFDESGEIDIDSSFPILYAKIKGADFFNVIAGAKPEMMGM